MTCDTLRRVLPRVLATDLDGTLLRSDGTVAPRTRRALEAIQAAGTEVVVCTARPVRWMRGLAAEGGIRGSAVCANGAVVWDLEADALLASSPLAPAAAREVVARLATLLPGGAWAVESVDSFGHEPHYEVRWPLPDDTLVGVIDELLVGDGPLKLLLQRAPGGHEAQVHAARRAVLDLVELTWSEPSASLLEMSAAGVSKASGLSALCAARGVDASEVIAFGDMPNDIAMLQWVGCGYAMGNAHPEVAAAADARTLSNQADGVAVVLERLLAGRTDAVPDAGTERMGAAILELLAARRPGATICPSEAARAVAGEADFRPLMDDARAAAAGLVAEGRIEVTQRGEVVDPAAARGPIRLRLRA